MRPLSQWMDCMLGSACILQAPLRILRNGFRKPSRSANSLKKEDVFGKMPKTACKMQALPGLRKRSIDTTLGLILSAMISPALAQGSAAASSSQRAMLSRYLTAEDRVAYLDGLVSSFLMQKQATDPFGLTQDPAKAAVVDTTVASTRQISLTEMVGLMSVTTIMPSSKSFLIGSRSVKQGDVLPLSFQGSRIKVQVMDVTSQQITFKNTSNGETASRKLDLMPAGMNAGNGQSQVPGLISNQSDAAIEIIAPEEDKKTR